MGNSSSQADKSSDNSKNNYVKVKSIIKNTEDTASNNKAKTTPRTYNEPLEETTINSRLQEHQYFHSKPIVEDTTNKFGINTKKDNKFCRKIEQLYEDEINYRSKVNCANEIPYTMNELDNEISNYNQYSNNNHSESHSENHYSNNTNLHTTNTTGNCTHNESYLNSDNQRYHHDNSNYNNSNYDTSNYNTNEDNNTHDLTITRDDALIIKDNKFLTNLEKRLLIMNNITLYDIDPLNIQNNERLRLKGLIEKYTSLRNIYHPDKTLASSSEMFITINSALQKLKYIQKSCIVEKDFNQLKSDYTNYNNNEKKKPVFINSDITKITPEKFNKFYDEHKYNDEYEDDGYGDMMIEGGIREDIDIKPIKVTENNSFLHQFEKQMQKECNNKIIEYSVPEPCNIDTNCPNICFKKSEFTGKSNSISYYDYKDAFSPIDIDRNTTNKNISYENYVKDRKSDNLELSDSKKRAIDKYESNLIDIEKTRQNNIVDYTRNIEKYNKDMSKFSIQY